MTSRYSKEHRSNACEMRGIQRKISTFHDLRLLSFSPR